MKRSFPLSLAVAGALSILPSLSHALDGTLKKIKDSGTATMGVRESSGGLLFHPW